MINVFHQFQQVRNEIIALENKYHRPPNSIKLIAVSKGQSAIKIQQAIQAGQRAFGENYVQEAIPKIEIFSEEKLEWHFIGRMQSNKAQVIAHYFDWVQSVDSLRVAHLLNQYRSPHLPKLQICIQVNISGEVVKGGIAMDQVESFINAINQLPQLQLRGLMCIPALHDSEQQQVEPFQKMHQLFCDLQQKGIVLDVLSMGMSHDFATAIAAGSTMVRIGTLLFGKREKHK